ncbi:MAG: threonine--tRNA ligase [Pseudomonadota bacterium]
MVRVLIIDQDDEKVFNVIQDVHVYEILRDLNVDIKDLVICRINDELKDLSYLITKDSCLVNIKIELIYMDNDQVLDVLRHDCAHVLAAALKDKYGDECRISIGPVINDMAKGHFYYDLHLEGDRTISLHDLDDLERRMKKLVKKNDRFIKEQWSAAKAIDYFKSIGETLKVEIIQDLISANANETITIYRQGDFIDLCRGPHGVSTKFSKHFKLLSVSGAYWRGDTKGLKLQRVYGTCWNSAEKLEKYLFCIKEAKQRNHIILARQLQLMDFSNIARGSVIWLPNGWILFCIIRDYLKGELIKSGYKEVNTPIIGNKILWEKSGHWSKFKENMFACVDVYDDILHENDRIFEGVDKDADAKLQGANSDTCNDDKDIKSVEDLSKNEDSNKDLEKNKLQNILANIPSIECALKPMNCPFHAHVFNTICRSYQDLPLRISEFGICHRNEASGALYGAMRVRQLTQDDGHIFCTEEQLLDEIKSFCKMLYEVYAKFGFKNIKVKLSTRPEQYAGELDLWNKAEQILQQVLGDLKIDFIINEGEGAFYGPKLEFVLVDVLERDWQCGTVQLDFVLPRRLSIMYIDRDNSKKYPVMIHRAILGSFERFIAILIEHYKGRFPVWLAPVQVIVNKISDEVIDAVKNVYDELKKCNFRVEMDTANSTMQAKIRNAELRKIPIILNIGKREAETGLINLRYDNKVENLTLQQIVEKLEGLNKNYK